MRRVSRLSCDSLSRKWTFAPRLEALESRTCPTTVRLIGDTLRILGDQAANNVRIVQNLDNDTIKVTYDRAGGMKTQTFAATQIVALNVNLKGGDDHLQYKMQTKLDQQLSLKIDLGTGKDDARLNFGPNTLGDLASQLAGYMRGAKDGDAIRMTTADFRGQLAGFRNKIGALHNAILTDVFVNGVALTQGTLDQFVKQFHVRPPAGHYWYDDISGACGIEGYGTGGFLPAGLHLGGPLRPDASGGMTQIFVNGRELTDVEVAFLEHLTGVQIPPGRYFVDGAGNAGLEGGPVLINLVQLANQNGYHASPSVLSTYDKTGVSVLADGSFTGVLVEGGGSVTFE